MNRSNAPILLAALAILAWTMTGSARLAGQTKAVPPSEVAQGDKEPSPASEDPTDAEDPDWFEKMLAREIELPEPQRIRAPDGSFRAQVPAELTGKLERTEQAWYVPLSFGTRVKMECWVYDQEADFGASLVVGSEGTFQRITDIYGELERREISKIDAGVLGPYPFLSVDWLYRVASESGPLAGQVKHMIIDQGAVSVYCLHNEPGYSQTFIRVMHELVDSLEHRATDDQPFYQEVHKLSLFDQPGGLLQVQYLRHEAGDIEQLSKMVILMAPDEETLVAWESYAIEWSTPDGALINALSLEAENGEILTNLQLDPVEAGWRAQGLFQGKQLDVTFDAQELSSTLGEMLALRKLIRSNRKTAELQRWDPIDPTQAHTYRMTVVDRTKSGNPSGTIRAEMGPMTLTAQVDARGSVREMDTSFGPVTLHAERVHASGSPPRP